MKKALSLLFGIAFMFPMIRDGNVVHNANYVSSLWQKNKFVFMKMIGKEDPVSLSFDTEWEAVRFMHCFEEWLAKQNKN